MSVRCARLFSSFGRGLAARRELTRCNLVGIRYMSVTNLSDLEATDKFCDINKKSVLYFTATWCSPCKAIKPVFEELSEKYGDIGFGKVDIDDNQEAATVYQISSVPTFIFFNGGKDNFAGHFSGANKDQLISSIEALDKA